MPPRPTDPAARARDHLLAERRDLLESTLDCADRVAAAWDAPPTDRERVVAPLRAALADAGVLDAYPDALADAVRAAGFEMAATPVPSPPYVAVTSTGPVLRATVSAGRLVARVETFAVERDPTRYVRVNDTPDAALSVVLR